MFVRDEIQVKIARVRAMLDDLGLDAALVKKTANYAWLTGGGINYVGVAGEVGVFPVLVARDRLYVIANNIEMARVLDEELLREQGYEPVSYPWYKETGEADAVAGLVGSLRLGSDCGFAGAKDVNGPLARLRWSLTPWEIDRYRELGRLTAAAMDETCRGVRPGDSECAVAGRLAGRLWADRIDYITLLAAADDRIDKYRHPCVTGRKAEKVLMLSVNSRKGGLIMSLTRFVHFGKVPEGLRTRYRDTLQVHALMAAATRPGRDVSTIFDEAVRAYRDLGYPGEEELHHQGGATGYAARDYKAYAGSTEKVLPNQAFAWNPTITGGKSETVMLAGEGGPELLSTPGDYPTLTASAGGLDFVFPDILELS